MPDYRDLSDYRDPNDPSMRGFAYEPYARRNGGAWTWIAGAAFLVVAFAIVFGGGRESSGGREPNWIASNDVTPTAPGHTLPLPVVRPATHAVPGLVTPPSPTATPDRP